MLVMRHVVCITAVMSTYALADNGADESTSITVKRSKRVCKLGSISVIRGMPYNNDVHNADAQVKMAGGTADAAAVIYNCTDNTYTGEFGAGHSYTQQRRAIPV